MNLEESRFELCGVDGGSVGCDADRSTVLQYAGGDMHHPPCGADDLGDWGNRRACLVFLRTGGGIWFINVEECRVLLRMLMRAD